MSWNYVMGRGFLSQDETIFWVPLQVFLDVFLFFFFFQFLFSFSCFPSLELFFVFFHFALSRISCPINTKHTGHVGDSSETNTLLRLSLKSTGMFSL